MTNDIYMCVCVCVFTHRTVSFHYLTKKILFFSQGSCWNFSTLDKALISEILIDVYSIYNLYVYI